MTQYNRKYQEVSTGIMLAAIQNGDGSQHGDDAYIDGLWLSLYAHRSQGSIQRTDELILWTLTQ